MKKQMIQCLVVDRDAEVTASLDAALRHASGAQSLERVASLQQLIPALTKQKPNLLFCPQLATEGAMMLLETLQRHSPDTLLVQVSRHEWQGLTTWLAGVESCTVPIADTDYFGQYVEFLLRYASLKYAFRQSKHLLGVAELRCHWLVDYSWEAIAYVAQGVHLYANSAYLSLFGFPSMTALQALPVAQLVAADERKTFEALGRVADAESKPSNRVLMSLRTVTGVAIRAEVRFIPAVLKGKRCYQLHVRPLERPDATLAMPHPPENPWSQASKTDRGKKLPPPVSLSLPRSLSPAQHLTPPQLVGMQAVFTPAMKLRERLPALYFAEPVFQPQPGRSFSYLALVRRLRDAAARFRLDYWNVGQAMLHLLSRRGDASSYLVFVSVGEWIFDNENWRGRLAMLLRTVPDVARQLVVAVQYRDCLADVKAVSKVVGLLQSLGVCLAIDNLLDDARALKFVRAIKPALVRLTPELAANVAVDTEEARYLHKLTHQLGETGCRVIISGVNDVTTLNLVCATSAAYLQGRVTKLEESKQ